MHRILLIALANIFLAGLVMAQQPMSISPKVTPASIGIRDTTIGKLYYVDRNAPPRAIEFKERTVASTSFISQINHYFNIPGEFSFLEEESNTDNLGMRHRLLRQYYKGIPLEGMGYRTHEKGGFMTSANGKAVRRINSDIQATITEEQAFQMAIKNLNAKETSFRPGKKLIVSKDFTFTPQSFKIAFQFDIDISLIEHWRISVDARNGEIINKVSLVNSCHEEIEPPLPYSTGTGLSNYYGTRTIQVEKFQGGSSRLFGETANGGKIGTYSFGNVSIISLLLFFEYHEYWEIFSSDNTYNDPYHKPAVSVQWAAEQAFEYFYTKHDRNSFDNNGSLIKSYVHVDRDLNNAFWTHNLLAFGDGSDNNPLVELDVVAHELTHGVTQYEAGLQYYNESGALNESFSDIFGKAVEFDTFGDTATWQIARRFREGGMRDLSNPNLKGQPDTYAGDMWFTGFEDNGGVHYNSGVQNFWFYLLCEGGSGVNDHQSPYSVNAIGMEAAVKIAYRNLTEYLIGDSDYLDSRIGSLLATADLYGANSAIYQEVDKAWDAVGVIDEPIITSLEVYDITATTVKLKGSLLPRGNIVEYHFEYGTTPALGTSSSTYYYVNSVEGILTGLQSETKYYLKLVATNENGSTSYNSTFTTISLAPLVKIKPTVDVTENSAMLYGLINPNSLPTSFYFEYGPTPAFGFSTPTHPLADGTEYLNVSATINGLLARQTYYYRLVATNAAASVSTGSTTFFTAGKPVITSFSPPTGNIGAEVIISGQNFSPLPEKNFVSFGATRATVLSSTTTELIVRVPAGASLAPISVLDTESGLTAESSQDFVPTYTEEFHRGDLQLTMGSTDYIYQTIVQDMDGDNKPDIVARHYLGFSVFQNVNQGGDISDASFVRNTFNSDNTPGTLALVDFDGNGLKDIVGRYPSGLRIYPNFSVPGYTFFGTPVTIPVAGFDLVFADFDMDGHVDIAGTSTASNDATTFIVIRNQNPKGILSSENFEQRFEMTVPYYVHSWYSGDFNNDGKPELFGGAYRKTFLPVMKNNGRPGVFEFAENNIQNAVAEDFPRYLSQDLNEDGWRDIILHASSQNADISILENNGNSTDITLGNRIKMLTGKAESAVQAGDINGDGKIDLLVGMGDGKVVILKNNTAANERLSISSFESFEEFGTANSSISSQIGMTVSDLNGDGRPEVINTYSYNTFPNMGYQMEVWQNSPNNCPDPAAIKVVASRHTATITLPPNTSFDEFEVEYAPLGWSWQRASSTTLDYLSPGYSYQLRVRAKCHLGFTGYHYTNFSTDCVDIDNLSIIDISASSVTLDSYELSLFEIQYSEAGRNQWKIVPQYVNQIRDLAPGTNYDLRLRGRCNTTTEFHIKQFTTLCPALSSINITNLNFNSAKVNWTSSYAGNAILEYSTDNASWNLIGETGTITSLNPGTQYFVRASLQCADINSNFINTSFTTPCPRVSMLSMASITPFSAHVSWTDASDTRRYTLIYSLTAGGATTTIETNSTSFVLEGLSPGASYTISVAPECIGGKNFTSTSFSTVCYVPFDLSAGAVTFTTADLSWSDNFGGLPYSIDYSILGSSVWHKAETASTSTTLTKLRPGTRYEARVHITCVSQTAPYASVIFETLLYQETTFAPNPTASKTIIYPSKNLAGSRFTIFDSMGKIVADGELSDYTIDLSIFPRGVYTLTIEGEKPMRIVKN